MQYTNPIIKGFYPDPSVCAANGKYYLVCSSFHYFPGIPLFESEDLVNWKQIGHVLTRESQLNLKRVGSSSGIFAPTIRFHNGRFYVVAHNDATQRNFYVYTDNIHGEWSDPVFVNQDGIDPSLYFEKRHTYFISSGTDSKNQKGIVQCEINIATGARLTKSRVIWQGSGGRFLEGPHMYLIDGTYYLIAAEGGTEYGHMITCARASSVSGPFESNPNNPVLTNRNKAPFIIQGIGHGDLIQDAYGDWHMISLGFRQQSKWMPYHSLGREVFMTPVTFHEDGWFTAGTDGTTDFSYEIQGDFEQEDKTRYTFENTDPSIDWCYIRQPFMINYTLSPEQYTLYGCEQTLNDTGSPTFIGLRQRGYSLACCTELVLDRNEAGLVVYMSEDEHCEIALHRVDDQYEAIYRMNIGGAHQIKDSLRIKTPRIKLGICCEDGQYSFIAITEDEVEHLLGFAQTKYLSSEVSGGFTGVIIGLYATGQNTARFTNFYCRYDPEEEEE